MKNRKLYFEEDEREFYWVKETPKTFLIDWVEKLSADGTPLDQNVKWKNLKVSKDNLEYLDISWKDMEKKAVKVLYTKHSISLEFFHGISDASGGFFILKDLIIEYLCMHNQSDYLYDCNKNSNLIF